MSTAYHPQTDGQSEALNKCVEQYLRCYVTDTLHKWVSILSWEEYWYNTAYQTSVGMSPFKALYGRDPSTIARYILGRSPSELVEAYFVDRDKILALLKLNFLKAQTRMKNLADKHHTELKFAEGDWVFVKFKPYRQNAVPDTDRIHYVFHVSMLKRCIDEPAQQVTPLQLTDFIPPSDKGPGPLNLEDKWSFNMEDQKLLKVFIDDSIQDSIKEMKDSFSKEMAEMRELLIEVVAHKTRTEINRRDPAMEIARQEHVPWTAVLRHKPASVKFGRFRGDNLEAWIFQAERYFEFYRIETDQQLTMASFYLDS
nr:uncharacterized protein LOC104087358 [Nicotiana tomentosiformis]